MLHPIDFVTYVRLKSDLMDRSLLARIALNALYDYERYPVDLSELAELCCESRVMARAFLAWCAIDPEEWSSWPQPLCECLFKLVPGGRGQRDEIDHASE